MNKERDEKKEQLLAAAEKISEIKDLDFRDIAKAFMMGYIEGHSAGLRAAGQQKTA